MKTIRHGDVRLTFPDDVCEEHTLKFLNLICGLCNKSLRNPASQLNTLSFLFAGKAFYALASKRDDTGPNMIMQLIKSMPENLLSSVHSSANEVTEDTIQDVIDNIEGRRDDTDDENDDEGDTEQPI